MRQHFLLSSVIVVLLAALVFAGTPVNQTQPAKQMQIAPVIIENQGIAPEVRSINSAPPQMNSILIDSSRNGYGFSTSGPKSADMATDLTDVDWLGMAYRMFVPGDPNSGIIGVAEMNATAGFDYSNFTFQQYINAMANFGLGGRYPSFVAMPEGPVPIWNQYFTAAVGTGPTESDAFLSFDFFGWGPFGGGWIAPESWSQNSNPADIHSLWLGHTDIKRDQQGVYHAGGWWEIDLNTGNQTFIHGTSTDLQSWTWENASVDISATQFEGNSPRFAYGSDGFGAWMTTGHFMPAPPASDDFKIMFATTNDWGLTWSAITRLDYEADLGIPEYIYASDSIYVPDPNGNPILYEDSASVGVTYDHDLIVLPNDELHFGCTISWGPYADQAAGTYYPNGLYMGLYDVHSSDKGQTWTSSRIAWNAGLLEGDTTGSYVTTNEIDLGYDDEGNIFAAWLDRDRTNVVPSTFPRFNTGITSNFNLDVWSAVSQDGGNTWSEAKQLTDDQQNCAMGLRLATRSRYDANYPTGRTYMLYMIPDLTRPLPPPVEILADHVQWLYVAEAKDYILDIDNDPAVTVDNFMVHQNYPNPFNPVTNLQIDLAKTENVEAVVYNTLGQKVATLFNGKMQQGSNTLQWNAANQPSGVYILQVKTAGRSEARKMMLMK
ncbi:MAG: T9SS type A sorting domain-containing protein [Calditrichia bacterium]